MRLLPPMRRRPAERLLPLPRSLREFRLRQRSQPAPAAPPSPVLSCRARWYLDNLQRCNEAMLQYEWAWLVGRIHALQAVVPRLERTGPHHPAASDADRAASLLSEARLFLSLLLRELAARGVSPAPARGVVIPSEEAWEITSRQIREEWGFQ